MEGKQFNIRTLIISILLALLLIGFVMVLYNLQIVKGDEYRAASTVKIANTVTVEAARGGAPGPVWPLSGEQPGHL